MSSNQNLSPYQPHQEFKSYLLTGVNAWKTILKKYRQRQTSRYCPISPHHYPFKILGTWGGASPLPTFLLISFFSSLGRIQIILLLLRRSQGFFLVVNFTNFLWKTKNGALIKNLGPALNSRWKKFNTCNVWPWIAKYWEPHPKWT